MISPPPDSGLLQGRRCAFQSFDSYCPKESANWYRAARVRHDSPKPWISFETKKNCCGSFWSVPGRENPSRSMDCWDLSTMSPSTSRHPRVARIRNQPFCRAVSPRQATTYPRWVGPGRWVRLAIRLEYSEKGGLWKLHTTDHLHSFLPLALPLEQFTLAGDIPAVALRRYVLP